MGEGNRERGKRVKEEEQEVKSEGMPLPYIRKSPFLDGKISQ